MKSGLNIYSVGLFVSFCLTLTGCFTGVEGTKEITQKDVDKVVSKVELEKEAIAIQSDSFPDWKIGKEFYITDNNINKIFLTNPSFNNDTLELKGKLIKYVGYVADKSLDSRETINIHFKYGDNDLIYPINKTLKEITNSKIYLTVPFLIDMDDILSVKELIKGKELYIRTSIWYDVNSKMINGEKYIKVNIDDIVPGNTNFPYKIKFSTHKGTSAYLFMSSNNSSIRNRSYGDLFSETDVRNNYPTITDINWARIIKGDIAFDMTKDECRLSLGSPKNIERMPSYEGVKEYWSYGNGMYLIFEDGLLKKYRK